MATNNSINLKVTNNADGFDVAGGTTTRKLTVSGGDVAIAGSGAAVITFPATTSTLLYSGGALGTPASGTVTNLTGTASININGTVGATTPTTVVGTTITANTGFCADANDGAYLGVSGTAFSDLFLASGGVINWSEADVTLTHAANLLTLAGGDLAISNLTASEIVITDANKKLVSAAVATYPSLTELSYVKGASSALQTQITARATSASPTFTGTITVSDNCRVDLTLPTANTYCTGNTTDSFAAGYSSAIGDLVFFGSAGKWLEADADAVATCKGLMGIALEAKTDTQAMKVALPGSMVRLDAWNWTVGDTLYAGETLGAMQNTIPTGADAIIKVVGFALSADVIYFNPSPDQQSTVS